LATLELFGILRLFYSYVRYRTDDVLIRYTAAAAISGGIG